MRDGLTDLSAFVAVATHRSFSRAAAELGLSPSALSHTVRGLEERLDLRLLNRTTRSVAPTEAGERLLERLRPALRDIADALEDANVFRDKPAGREGPGRRGAYPSWEESASSGSCSSVTENWCGRQRS